jgi:hypothetical protein
MATNIFQNAARLATLDQLILNTLPNFIAPVPSRETLRALFDRENVPRFKSNPNAERGGGPVFYSVAGVEKIFRTRLMPGRLKVVGKIHLPPEVLA